MTFLKFSVLDKNIKDSSINNRIINKEKIFYYQVVKIKKKQKTKKHSLAFLWPAKEISTKYLMASYIFLSFPHDVQSNQVF